MPFAVAGAGIAAAAGIAGSAMQAGAARSGQAQAQKQFEQQRADLAPYREAGVAPLETQNALLGLSGPEAAATAMANFQKSPGYTWQFDEGLRAVDAGAAASGLLRSGAAIKAEEAFGSGLAAQEFGNYFNRLYKLSAMGESAAAGGAVTANEAAQTAIGGANAQSSIYGNTASQLGGTANALLNNKDFQGWLKGTPSTPTVGSPYTPSIYGVPSPY